MILTAVAVISSAAFPIFGTAYGLGFCPFAPTVISGSVTSASLALFGPKVFTNYGPDLCKMIIGFLKGQPKILQNGTWEGLHVGHAHFFDHQLSLELCRFLKNEKAKSVADFGCGTGEYVQNIRTQLNILADGFDGNPDTPAITKGTCKTLDLSAPVKFEQKYDWVMSLEVGEHLPKQYEQTFIDNLIANADKGIVLSWAKKGQGGHGHVNEQNNDYIKAIFEKKGWVNDVAAEQKLRDASYPIYFWFYDTVMVFRKSHSQ